MKQYITVSDEDGVDMVFPDVEDVAEFLCGNTLPSYAQAVREWFETDMSKPCFITTGGYTDAWSLHDGDYDVVHLQYLVGDEW